MTKVSVLGQEPEKFYDLEDVEISYCLQERGNEMYPVDKVNLDLEEYTSIVLVSNNYTEGVDVFLAKHPDYGDVLFTGKLNCNIV